jgi:hypothetical protein
MVKPFLIRAKQAYVMTPSRDRTSLHICRAVFPEVYLQALQYPDRALPCSIPVRRLEVLNGDDTALINAICDILTMEEKPKLQAAPQALARTQRWGTLVANDIVEG